MKSYHFDLGNSNEGPIGMCAVVHAKNPTQALKLLRDLLPEEIPINVDHDPRDDAKPHVEYVQIYLNDVNVTVKDIDDVQDVVGEKAS